MVGDCLPAATAGLMVTPVVCAVDKATVENTAGRSTLVESMRHSVSAFSRSPVAFYRQPAARYIMGVYGGTYAVNNLFTSYEEAQGRSMPVAKTATIFLGNSSLSLWKDAAFARLFGSGVRASPPASALACWWSRDFISMAVIFVGPGLVGQHLSRMTNGKVDVRQAEIMAQLSMPFLLQPVITPLHLVGFMKCNDANATFSQQVTMMKQQLPGTVVLRWIRGIPPYSLGTVVNKEMRRSVHESLRAYSFAPLVKTEPVAVSVTAAAVTATDAAAAEPAYDPKTGQHRL